MKVRKIAFLLTFPHCQTWNGQTTVNDRIHCIVREVPMNKAKELLKNATFDYLFSDGWLAQIECRSYNMARREIRDSSGFLGYEWMVDSLMELGFIVVPDERKRIGARLNEIKTLHNLGTLKTNDDVKAFCDKNQVPVQLALSVFARVQPKSSPCDRCKHIAFFGSGMYPCNSCSRVMKDLYEKQE